MAFDGLMMYKVVNELKNSLIGGKVDKIFEPNSNEIVLGIYNNGMKYALDIVTSSSNYRICLSTNQKPNPTYAPNFCMVLRKYLLNTRITNLTTLDLERVCILEFEGHNKSGDFTPKRLIIELMGKHSNVILVNSDNVIIDALKHFDTNSNSYRDILPGHLYYFPVSDKLNFIEQNTANDFYCNLIQRYPQEDILLSLAISNTYIGFSKSSIIGFIEDLGIDDVVNKSNCEKLFIYIQKLINSINNICVPLNEKDYYLSFSANENLGNSYPLNFYVDDYYSSKESSEDYINYRNNFSRLLLNHLKKLSNKLDNINNKLDECKDSEKYKLYGELITSNLYKINNIHLDNISLENYYDNNNILIIPLDKSITPGENAKKYFKKYHKLKNAKLIVENQKVDVEQEIDYLESIIYSLHSSTTIDEIDEVYNEFSENFKNETSIKQGKKKFTKKEKKKSLSIGEPLKYTIDNFQVLVGKNNKQNDFITKQASDDDIWFHTKDIHGSHVILKTNFKIPSQETLNKCAALAAFYSKASSSDNVPVDYTYVKYVKKPSKAKPGMVIYTNHKNVIVKPKQMP